MRHLKYSRNVNDNSTSQELVVAKRKFITILFIVVTRVVCVALNVCSKIDLFFISKSARLNLVVLKNILENKESNYSKRICLKRNSNCNNISHRYDQIVSELLRIANTQILKRLLKTHAKFDSSYFKSTNEKMIEIWTCISINKQSICSMTLSKQIRSKTMWISRCEMHKTRLWKKNACAIETCDHQNHHIEYLKYDFTFLSLVDDLILLIEKTRIEKNEQLDFVVVVVVVVACKSQRKRTIFRICYDQFSQTLFFDLINAIISRKKTSNANSNKLYNENSFNRSNQFVTCIWQLNFTVFARIKKINVEKKSFRLVRSFQSWCKTHAIMLNC